jgi:5-methylcytosine-specific restriction endonuclease McrA
MADPIVSYTGPIVTKAEAKAAGLKRFFTGVVCLHGHIGQRITASGACWPCANARTQAMYPAWAARNRDKLAENNRRYRAANPGKDKAYYQRNHAKIRAAQRERVRANPEPNRQAAREWALANPDGAKRIHRRWVANNPDKVAAFGRNNRALRQRAAGKHTAAEVAEIMEWQKGKCAYCRKAVGKRPHVDHIVPIAKGGTNDRRNLQITCGPCNLRKNRTDPIAFAQRIGLLI